MKPGKELDALIAEKVMGLSKRIAIKKYRAFGEEQESTLEYWGPSTSDYDAHNNYDKYVLPRYSTDISVAWLVVEHLDLLCGYSLSKDSLAWAILDNDGEDDIVGAESAPHAICLAALKAVGVEV